MGKQVEVRFPVIPFMLAAGVAAGMILAGSEPAYSLAVGAAAGVGLWSVAALFLVLVYLLS